MDKNLNSRTSFVRRTTYVGRGGKFSKMKSVISGRANEFQEISGGVTGPPPPLL